MLVIGERINATRKRIGEAIQQGNADLIREEALKQVTAGAQMLDVNGGVGEGEVEYLPWLVGVVQEVVDVTLCLDSANPEALGRALPLCRRPPIVNSTTCEPSRLEAVLSLLKEHKAGVIALCLGESGPPVAVEDRVENAGRLVEGLTAAGVQPQDIYVDPCLIPISTGTHHGAAALEAVAILTQRYPSVHTICGLSNVSFGLPLRKLLNQVYLAMLMAQGLDSVIADPCDPHLMAVIAAAEALRDRDEYCRGYLRAFREGRLGDKEA